jgi:hypothetical protein
VDDEDDDDNDDATVVEVLLLLLLATVVDGVDVDVDAAVATVDGVGGVVDDDGAVVSLAGLIRDAADADDTDAAAGRACCGNPRDGDPIADPRGDGGTLLLPLLGVVVDAALRSARSTFCNT